MGFNWEDPFGHAAHTDAPHAILPLNNPPPPVDIKAVRKRQKALLPYIHELRKAAVPTLRQIAKDRSHGGPLLLKQTECQILVQVIYRLPDRPDILGTLGPIPITDHAVVIAADQTLKISVLDQLFPTQKIGTTSPEQTKAIIEARKELGLIERPGIAVGAPDKNKIVVYPKLLHFTAHWITHIQGPIFDMHFAEHTKDSNVNFENAAYPKSPIPARSDPPKAQYN